MKSNFSFFVIFLMLYLKIFPKVIKIFFCFLLDVVESKVLYLDLLSIFSSEYSTRYREYRKFLLLPFFFFMTYGYVVVPVSKRSSFSFELPLHISEKSDDVFLGLFLNSLLCSIDLYVCPLATLS